MSEELTNLFVDLATGQEYSVALTEEELAEVQARAAAAEQAELDMIAAAEAKAMARASAIAKLQSQGLTQEEIEALYS